MRRKERGEEEEEEEEEKSKKEMREKKENTMGKHNPRSWSGPPNEAECTVLRTGYSVQKRGPELNNALLFELTL